jgi:hypothetical protein
MQPSPTADHPTAVHTVTELHDTLLSDHSDHLAGVWSLDTIHLVPFHRRAIAMFMKYCSLMCAYDGRSRADAGTDREPTATHHRADRHDSALGT